MQFHLDHTPKKQGFELDHSQQVFMIGSCFSENIGELLKAYRFKTLSNPSGILFNPSSIINCLHNIIHAKPIDQKYILSRHDVFFSYLHHSSVHDDDDTDLIKKINAENKKALQFLKESHYLVITFGTAFVYRHIGINETVANCHKQPQSFFEKHLLSVEQIVKEYADLINDLRELNPALKIIFTVSPVKYLKDGLVENNLSKSTLTLAVHEIIKQHHNCFYFPAYELVTDDLRDYRFYKTDLAHPNEQAIEYVWQKFSACFFSEKTMLLNQQIQKLNQALSHRKLIANSEEALKLNEFIIRQKEEIKKLNPGLSL